MSLETMALLQLADGCFPSGGFAFSNGLESLAKLGYLRRMRDFEEYLECHLEQFTAAELPFFNSAYAAGGPEAWEGANCGEGFACVLREWDAWLFMPSQRGGSLAQGQAWARAMEEAHPLEPLRRIRPWILARGLPLHFLMVFATTLRAAGFPAADGQCLLLHMALRDQLGAAVRLGLLGSLQAQKLHRRFLAIGEDFRRRRADWGHDMAVRGAPMIDLGQASHPHLYSKLFQS
jgi:urease accessory protein